ncbi:MAG: Coenzyme F420 hydrogenase/dehydrogenase, beta subunit C-terminal domain [Peptococcaceae bacterium]|nr:Coenzyme F420 hydrogenase/dehydrogenase, beta subunit C-terminal domain [Peptococcaceae bacterium]
MVFAAKGSGDLKKEVLDRGLCTACGMCVGMCPYIKTVREKVVVIHPCGLKEGNCYKVCPRTGIDALELDRSVFGEERRDQALGVYEGIYFARAADPAVSRAGQYGGVVTALAAFAVEQGVVGGAVLSGGTVLEPRPVLAKTAQEVISCAGSKYTAVPTLAALNGGAGDSPGSIGVVGRPCQVAAVRKGQVLARRNPETRIPAAGAGLVIGLFCFWSLGPDFYSYLEEKAGGENIVRVDIPVEGLRVTTSGGERVWPVDEIRPYIREACSTCIDPTSEWADLSVGSTEYDPAWNTLVVRSDPGRRLVNSAVEKGVVELKPYPEERLPILRRAVLNKKMRVLHDPDRPRPGYLEAAGGYAGAVKTQWEVLQP